MLRLELHPDAADEVEHAQVRYAEEASAKIAEAFAEEIDRGMNLILDMPKAWPSQRHGVRSFVLRRFPYSIVYRIDDDLIRVIAVAHHHRQPGYWRGRTNRP